MVHVALQPAAGRPPRHSRARKTSEIRGCPPSGTGAHQPGRLQARTWIERRLLMQRRSMSSAAHPFTNHRGLTSCFIEQHAPHTTSPQEAAAYPTQPHSQRATHPPLTRTASGRRRPRRIGRVSRNAPLFLGRTSRCTGPGPRRRAVLRAHGNRRRRHVHRVERRRRR